MTILLVIFLSFNLYLLFADFAPPGDDHSRRYPTSVDSHASIPSISPYADPGLAGDHYPAWSSDRQIPMSSEEIEDIFLDLTQKFGFQRDSMRNMVLPCPLCSLFFSQSTF